MDKLPLTYKPKHLRESEKPSVTEVAYVCGYLDGNRDVGAFAGPFAKLELALEEEPIEHLDAVIVRFNSDGTSDLLYAWNHANSCWCLMQNFD